ncbi:MAG: hypothetical protein ACOCYP_02660 [Planctomycetota bacterium]
MDNCDGGKGSAQSNARPGTWKSKVAKSMAAWVLILCVWFFCGFARFEGRGWAFCLKSEPSLDGFFQTYGSAGFFVDAVDFQSRYSYHLFGWGPDGPVFFEAIRKQRRRRGR